MGKQKVLIIYGIIFFSGLFFFLFSLFPEDKVNQHLVFSIQQMLPGYQIKLGESRFSLPISLKLSDVSVLKKENEVFGASAIKIGKPVLSLFTHGQSFFIQAHSYGGEIEGNVSKKENESGTGISADLKFDRIQIGDWPFLDQFFNEGVSGILNGTILYDDEKQPESGVINLQLTDVTIPLGESLLNLGNIQFNTITISGNLNGQEFSMTTGDAKGNMASAQLSGTISFKPIVNDSVLNLSGTFQPHHELLKNIPLGIFSKDQMGSKGIPITISGTFKKPVVELR